jgi:hypothetical protein
LKINYISKYVELPWISENLGILTSFPLLGVVCFLFRETGEMRGNAGEATERLGVGTGALGEQAATERLGVGMGAFGEQAATERLGVGMGPFGEQAATERLGVGRGTSGEKATSRLGAGVVGVEVTRKRVLGLGFGFDKGLTAIDSTASHKDSESKVQHNISTVKPTYIEPA